MNAFWQNRKPVDRLDERLAEFDGHAPVEFPADTADTLDAPNTQRLAAFEKQLEEARVGADGGHLRILLVFPVTLHLSSIRIPHTQTMPVTSSRMAIFLLSSDGILLSIKTSFTFLNPLRPSGMNLSPARTFLTLRGH